MPGRTTIAQVAQRAGVSVTTVSHTFSGSRPVSPSTRARVEGAARELRYRPNGVARSLRIKRSHTVALIVPDISNPYYPKLARGFQDVLAQSRYHVLLCNTDQTAENEAEYIADVLDRQADGIVIVAFHLETKDIPELFDEVPIVSVGPRLDHPSVDNVVSDDVNGAREATRLLLDRGRSVAMIGGFRGLPPSEARLAGFKAALRAAGVRYDAKRVVRGDFTREGGARAAKVLLTRADRPTGIFCANDLMAIGAMDVARSLGLAIPQDVALVGYDDIDAAALVTPRLTTVLNPAQQVGETAGHLLIERMHGYRGPRRRVVIPHRLITREST
jgi:LacI family transcriptional regulator